MSITYLAKTRYKRKEVRFGIKESDRLQHTYILGKTGTGKSTLLRNMILQDIWQGKGLALLDPHGDLVEEVIKHIPPRRTNQTIYFNPSDTSYPFGFNILDFVEKERQHLSVSLIVQSLKTLWGSSWGPRLEYLLHQTLSLLSEVEGTTLLGVNRVLESPEYREYLLSKIVDPYIHDFWTYEFPGFNKESFPAIQNKIGGLLSRKILRQILGQKRSSFNPRLTLLRGQILLANLSRGELGSDASSLLGALLTSALQMSAMSREDREHFTLYLDEFQHFTTGTLSELLSESRKFGLSLVLAHQYLDQLPLSLRKAVLGNIGTTIAFRCGYSDALHFSREFDILKPEDFTNLPKYNIYLRLAIDGVASNPFSAETLPPLRSNYRNRKRVIIQESRRRLGRPKEIVEKELQAWFNSRL